LPLGVWSDNGTSFVRLAKEIEENSQTKFTWTFSPPRAPHVGGVWESLVKMTKRHLHAVARNAQSIVLSDWPTVLCRIEEIMNNRPICLGANSDPLTPNHFIHCWQHNQAATTPKNELMPLSELKTAQQNIVNQFKKRWITEYRQTLILKWRKIPGHQAFRLYKPAVDDIVAMSDDLKPNYEWTTARVTRTFPGRDGQIRVVEVQSGTSRYIRAVRSLVPLLPSRMGGEMNEAVHNNTLGVEAESDEEANDISTQ
jgi:hypothetical protein